MYTHDSSLEEKYMQSYTCCHIMKINFRYLCSWLSKREMCYDFLIFRRYIEVLKT